MGFWTNLFKGESKPVLQISEIIKATPVSGGVKFDQKDIELFNSLPQSSNRQAILNFSNLTISADAKDVLKIAATIESVRINPQDVIDITHQKQTSILARLPQAIQPLVDAHQAEVMAITAQIMNRDYSSFNREEIKTESIGPNGKPVVTTRTNTNSNHFNPKGHLNEKLPDLNFEVNFGNVDSRADASISFGDGSTMDVHHSIYSDGGGISGSISGGSITISN